MYIYSSGRRGESSELVPVQSIDHWVNGAIRVFEGEFTVEADKERLVDTVLGLWGRCLEKCDEPAMKLLLEKVRNAHDEVFPVEHFRELPQLLEAIQMGTPPKTKSNEEKKSALAGGPSWAAPPEAELSPSSSEPAEAERPPSSEQPAQMI